MRRVEPHDAIALALDGLHVLNACDTAAVREGLLDDALLGKLARVRDQLTIVAAQARVDRSARGARRARASARSRAALADRLARAARGPPARRRAGRRRRRGGRRDRRCRARRARPALATCQLWYCEAATSGLSPAAQLGVLAAAVGAAHARSASTRRGRGTRSCGRCSRGSRGDGAGVRYRLRLVEAALAQRSIARAARRRRERSVRSARCRRGSHRRPIPTRS